MIAPAFVTNDNAFTGGDVADVFFETADEDELCKADAAAAATRAAALAVALAAFFDVTWG